MKMLSTRGLNIHPNKNPRHRNQNNGIIITHGVDLISQIKAYPADMEFDISDKCQINEHTIYFKKVMGYEHLPYHFFLETMLNEVFTFTGSNLSNRSEYLQQLTKEEVLNKQYLDWLLIVVNGNLNYDMIEKIMYTKLAYLVAGYMNYEHLSINKIKYLYDIVDKDKLNKTHFKILPMTHFDPTFFMKELMRFKDK